ncbi:hypothetical protein [Labilithrix luteola]|uniref:hypothetical protein n=1 Tax=Labilithrix luteola TaxID=1391654 RepID=UPI0011BA5975|nr:hypothetical protein [Labilithrix luteola]
MCRSACWSTVWSTILAGATALALLAVACSGSDEDGTSAPIKRSDAAKDAREEDTTTPPAPVREAGPAPIPVTCPIGTAVEVESNDTPEEANAFTETMFCGTLSSGDDVDYATFDTPPGKKLTVFQGIINGKVDFELSVGGSKFGPGDVDKFTSGTYLVKVFTKGADPASYRFRIQFD